MDLTQILLLWGIIIIFMIFLSSSQTPSIKLGKEGKARTFKIKDIRQNVDDIKKESSAPERKHSDIYVADLQEQKEELEAVFSDTDEVVVINEVQAEYPEDEIFTNEVELDDLYQDSTETVVYTIENIQNDNVTEEVCVSSVYAEEPWYEHKDIREILGDGDINTILEDVPQKFEIIEKEY